MRTIKLILVGIVIGLMIVSTLKAGVEIGKWIVSEPSGNVETLSHAEALKLCEDAGLIYDFEAEGTTTFELCYK